MTDARDVAHRFDVPVLVGLSSAGGPLSPDRSSALGDLQAIAEVLVAWGVPSVVLTLGARGSLVARPTADPVEASAAHSAAVAATSPAEVVATHVPAVPTAVVDTTGAGDMFVGAFAAHLTVGADPADAARVATNAASATVQFPGAQGSYFRAAGGALE